jgi:hypothetical protein
MKSITLDYHEFENVCLVDRADFDKFWSELYKLGVEVKTKRRPTQRAQQTAGTHRQKSKSKSKTSSVKLAGSPSGG